MLMNNKSLIIEMNISMEFKFGLFPKSGVEKIKLLVLPTAGISNKTGTCKRKGVKN